MDIRVADKSRKPIGTTRGVDPSNGVDVTVRRTVDERNARFHPRTAFSRFSPVPAAKPEGRLWVQKLWGRRQRSGTVVVVRKPIEVPHDAS
jgi:hypothetical protein